MPVIAGTFRVDGLPRDGATVQVYNVSAAFSANNPPQGGDPLPSGGIVATGTTGPANGGAGAWRFTDIPAGEYYVGFAWLGLSAWEYASAVGASGGLVTANNFQRAAIASISANYSLPLSGAIILADASGGPITVTLPDLRLVGGTTYTVTKTDSSGNTVTVVGLNGQTINDQSSLVIAEQYSAAELLSDGTMWRIA